MKKVLSAVIALTAVAAMSVSAFAVDAGSTNGSAEGTADKDGKVTLDNSVSIEGLKEGDKVTVDVEAVAVADKDDEDAIVAKAGEGTKLNTVITITGVTLEDGQTATVTVAYDGVSNKVAYVSDDNKTVELIDLSVSDDKTTASFKTTHFSTFYLVTVDENGTPGDNTDDGKGGDDAPATGVVLAIVPAAVAAAAVVVSKKRK